MLEWRIDDWLRAWALAGLDHFSPAKICQDLGTDDMERVYKHLHSVINAKVILYGEALCPAGHVAYRLDDISRIPVEPYGCAVCDPDGWQAADSPSAFTATAERIEVRFEFTDAFRQWVRRKQLANVNAKTD